MIVTTIPVAALAAREPLGAGSLGGNPSGGPETPTQSNPAETRSAVLRSLARAAQHRGGNLLQELVDRPSGDTDGESDAGQGAGPPIAVAQVSHPGGGVPVVGVGSLYQAACQELEAEERAQQAARGLHTSVGHSPDRGTSSGALVGGEDDPEWMGEKADAGAVAQWFRGQPGECATTRAVIRAFRSAVPPDGREAFRTELRSVATFDSQTRLWRLTEGTRSQ